MACLQWELLVERNLRAAGPVEASWQAVPLLRDDSQLAFSAAEACSVFDLPVPELTQKLVP